MSEAKSKKATFRFPSFLKRPPETHEVFKRDGSWKPTDGALLRDADYVVTEDGVVIKERWR